MTPHLLLISRESGDERAQTKSEIHSMNVVFGQTPNFGVAWAFGEERVVLVEPPQYFQVFRKTCLAASGFALRIKECLGNSGEN